MDSDRTESDHARDALLHYAQTLGDDEVRVLSSIGQRLAMGQEQYGLLSLSSDPRSWTDECVAELRDAVVYLTCEMMRRAGA